MREEYGLEGAYTAALATIADGCTASAKLAETVTLADGRQVCVYVKAIRFDAAKLEAEPLSGGLLETL
jgi:hypothetical protein